MEHSCDECQKPSMVLHEVEQDGDRLALCNTCFEEGDKFDLLLGTRYATPEARPEPREFNWEDGE